MTQKSKAVKKKADPKVRTFFLLAFPSILIVALAMLFPNSWEAAIIMIMLVVYQFIMLKQFIDQYYEVL